MTANNAKSLVTLLKAKYPDPMSIMQTTRVQRKGRYCVGGALILHLGKRDMRDGNGVFPIAGRIGEALQILNPNLSWDRAARYGYEIIGHNENRQFEQAWAVVESALEYGETK